MMKSTIGRLLMTAVIVCSTLGGGLPVRGIDRVNGRRQRSRAVRGYYCGQQIGNRSGDFYFRAGSSGVRMFNMAFGLESGNAKLIGFKFDEMTFGNEYLIRYRSTGGGEGYIESLKSTGRKKVTAPCPVE